MRVEKFSLFFPPRCSASKTARPSTRIGAIPAGGYVKISGMNPAEDLPDEVRTRAYYSQPVWKRIVVIATGPAMNLFLAFLLLFVFIFLIGPTTGTRPGGRDREEHPAASVLKPGDRLVAVDGKRGDSGRALPADRVAQVRAGPADRRAARPRSRPRCTVERDGARAHLRATPVYDPVAERTRLGFAYAPGPRENAARWANRSTGRWTGSGS